MRALTTRCHNRHEPYNLKVDTYSYAMIVFQLFEGNAPFQGMDPVDAARQAAMTGARPGFPPRNTMPQTAVVSSTSSQTASLQSVEKLRLQGLHARTCEHVFYLWNMSC